VHPSVLYAYSIVLTQSHEAAVLHLHNGVHCHVEQDDGLNAVWHD